MFQLHIVDSQALPSLAFAACFATPHRGCRLCLFLFWFCTIMRGGCDHGEGRIAAQILLLECKMSNEVIVSPFPFPHHIPQQNPKCSWVCRLGTIRFLCFNFLLQVAYSQEKSRHHLTYVNFPCYLQSNFCIILNINHATDFDAFLWEKCGFFNQKDP